MNRRVPRTARTSRRRAPNSIHREDIMRVCVTFAALLLAAPALAQEKLVGNDASVRTTLTFKAVPAAVQKVLPDGWEVASPSSGPSTGSNLVITFIEGVFGEDPQGKPTPAGRNIVIGVPAR